MPIRVLHVIGSLKLGGAQICVKYLVENATSGKIETFVYPLRCQEIDIPINGNIIINKYKNYDIRKFFDILRLCRSNNIDIIHAHLEKPVLGSLLATFFCNVKVVIHEHGPVFRKGYRYVIYRVFLRLLRKRASVFIAVSNSAAEQLTTRAWVSPDQIRVINNAVDREKFAANHQTRIDIRKQLSIKDSDIVIGYLGRLNSVKGVDTVINAMPALLKQNPDYLFIVLGHGPELNSLKALAGRLKITDRVKFLGFIENASEVMNSFDIGVVPSRQEPFGIVALEFMSMQIPLVSSGVDGLGELVSDRETAMVSEADNTEQIAACIDLLTKDKQLNDRITSRAYEFSSKFGIPQYVQAVEEVYENLMC